MPSTGLVRVYSDRKYSYTTVVRHQGTTVAFAMDDRRHIYYSVLNLDQGNRARGEIDSAYWNDNPVELQFPAESVDVGGTAEPSRMPVVKLGGRVEAGASVQLQADEKDPFLSSTARLGAAAPFQVVSDGRYLLVLRQSIDSAHADAVFRSTDGTISGQQGSSGQPVVSNTVLCDRFVQVGSRLQPVLEIRYRRSRSRTRAASSGDTLGTTDLDGNPFYEPTRQLSFIRNVTAGKFTALLLPTQVDGVSRWQFFAANDTTKRIDSFSVERSVDGLFNVDGTQLFTSSDPRYAGSVLERQPGTDPFTNKPLVPVPLPTDRSGCALRLDGTTTFVSLGAPAPTGPYTVEAWIKPAAPGGTILACHDEGNSGALLLRMDGTGMLVLSHYGGSASLTASKAAATDRDSHVAAVFDGTTATVYLNGAQVATGPLPYSPVAGAPLLVGARGTTAAATDLFAGSIDEVRIWSRARTASEIGRDRSRRLAGNETGLTAYYRLDEGTGTTARDHTDAGLDGTINGTATWVTSTAPVGDSPGLSRETFSFAGRAVVSPLASVLYYQQEDVPTGYVNSPQPAKRQARVLLSCATSGPAPEGGSADRAYLATLDLAVAADGRLAQAPRQVTLTTIGKPVSASGAPDAAAPNEAVSAAQDAVRSAQAQVNEDLTLSGQLEATTRKLADIENACQAEWDQLWYCPWRYQGWYKHPWERQWCSDEIGRRRDQARAELRPQIQRQKDARDRLTADQLELTRKKVALATLTRGMQGSDDVVLSVPPVATDGLGLSITGGLLAFAWTPDAPVLLDSGTGDIVLYFRGGDGQFFAAYYDVKVSRLIKDLAVGDGRVRLHSRDVGMDAAALAVKVSDDTDPARCVVVLTRTLAGQTYTETFRAVPRKADQFAAVLSGTVPDGELLGTVSTADGTSVVLAAGLPRDVAAGTAVTAGRGVLQLGDAAAKGDTKLKLSTAPATAPLTGSEVRTVVYDYACASADRPGARLDKGSLLFAADAGTTTATVPNGDATGTAAGWGCRWHGSAPGRAYSFDGARQRFALAADQLDKVALPKALTMEAWADPTHIDGQSRVLNVNGSGGQYALGVSDAPMATALSFDGTNDYLDCGKISMGGLYFTVEFWARRQATGRTDTVVSQQALYGSDVMQIGFRDNDTFAFTFDGSSLSTPAYPDLAWHHWAVTYNPVSHQRTIYRDGQQVAQDTTAEFYTKSGAVQLCTGPQGRAKVQIDEVRLWNVVRSADELQDNHSRRLTGQEPGLLGYWSFAGRQTLDLSEHGRDCTVFGNPQVVESGLRGYRILAGVGSLLVRSRDVYPTGQWGHIACAFTQGAAVRLDGTGWLDAGSDDAFNLTAGLTIVAFLRLDALGGNQGIVGKGVLADGGKGTVPYAFMVAADGKLTFIQETGRSGELLTFSSDTKLQAGAFYKVAVTRKPTSSGVDIRFYIDGKAAGQSPASTTLPAPGGNDAPVEIGRVQQGKASYNLSGLISEVRIWSTARDQAQIGAPISPGTGGLVAQWQFQENAGNTAADTGGNYPARLHGATWDKTPDPTGRFSLYHDGNATVAEAAPAGDAVQAAGYGPTQFTVGGRVAAGGALQDAFTGVLDEIRIWRTARTAEQILDNVFTRLRGETEDLIAYYPFDANSTVAGAPVRDAGLRGNDLVPATGNEPQLVLSTAPIATDTAEVRSALTGIRTPLNRTISAPPGVCEYADVQRTQDRRVQGVLKRCYAYLKDGRWYLVTGYKVGNLISEWVGQAQFDPQLIGFIEGAPPVPSENLVVAPGTGDYRDASKVAFTQADEVTNSLSSNKDISVEMAAKAKFKWAVTSDVRSVTAPLGMGTAQPLAKFELEVALNFSLEYSNGWTTSAEVSEGRNTARASSVALSGSWEDPEHIVNPAVGRRWIPANIGFALVQSDTADVFAIRLEHSRALVAYRMAANPDIPRDWNIIQFPINPYYTKQGTLDGLIGNGVSGVFPDPDHYADIEPGGDGSYYKPKEAYAIKRRIEQQQQQLQGFYDSVSTETHDKDPTYDRANKVLANMGGTPVPRVTGGKDSAGPAANKTSARRNLANTYVWTADGGFFAETNETTDVVTRTTAGSYSVKGSVSSEGMFGAGASSVGFKGGYEVSIGGGSTVTRTKKQESKQTFKLDVECVGGKDLRRYKEDGTVAYDPTTHKPVNAPGRVDAYRFITFYLDTAKENFEDFYGKVVDPLWLATSPQAAALRQANQSEQQPPCWRVLHRVTFVSRLLDPSAATGDTPSLAKAMQAEGIRSTYDLVKLLEPYLKADPANLANMTNLTRATSTALTAHLYRLTPYAPEITGHLARYFGIG